jgi:formylglycine-generating enzyme
MKNHRQTFNDTPLAFNLIFIKSGTFKMGSERHSDEKPIHAVTLSDYWIGEVPVTQALWAHVMQDTDMADPSNFKGDNRPVERVSWENINNEFLPRLNQMTKGLRPKDSEYRLPTEAQWEYAARGGEYWKEHPFEYSGSDKINEVAWYDENSHRETKPVGLKTPNLLGLYDMSGNVWEWCEDQWHSDYNGAPIDGSAWVDKEGGSDRVMRGGSWFDYSEFCRPSIRHTDPPPDSDSFIGFRLVLFSPSV